MALSWNEIRDRARKFSKDWAGESSEDAEAKSFWNDFFDVFGVNRRRVATFEHRVKKIDGKDGYIDLLWKGMLLVEHKSRGKDLDRAHTQAKDYFHGLKESELPRYVLVSDFERFRLYDYDNDADFTEFNIKDLHKHVRQFGFLAGYTTHAFKEEDPVNIAAAERMGKLHDALKDAGYDGHALEVLLVRLLFCLFADDTSIFAPRQFHEFIIQRTNVDGSDLGLWLAKVFQVLDTPPGKRPKALDEQMAEFPYVNGKLFAEALPLSDFNKTMRDLLIQAAELDWSQISPAIFGSLFQSVMDAQLRRNLGAHYTTEKNILKLIKPLFLDDLYEELEKVKGTPAKLKALHGKLANLRFLDPACGCGNFLVIAYRELRLLELEVLKAMFAKQGSLLTSVGEHVAVDVDQFYGIEIEEFPAQIAQVALWLMDHQMNLLVSEHFGEHYARLPLVKSATIINDDALFLDWQEACPSVNYIIGNPPFIGKNYRDAAQDQAMEHIFAGGMGGALPKVSSFKSLDFVCSWHFKATAYMKKTPATITAFVSTNSITQGEQVAILWSPLLSAGVNILFAHRTFKWNNEARGNAAVHCVIIGFGLVDKPNKLIFDYENIGGDPHLIQAKQINPYLLDAPNIVVDGRSTPLSVGAPEMVNGNKPADGGFLLMSANEKDELLRSEPRAADYIQPFSMGDEFINSIPRFCLWLVNCPPNVLREMPKVLERVQSVKAMRAASTKEATRRDANKPSLFAEIRQPAAGNYLALPRVSSENRYYIPIGYLPHTHIAGDKLQTIPGASLYDFGVITSAMHMAWMRITSGRMKSDYQYSAKLTYNTFPWPSPDEKQKSAIEQAAQSVIDARARYQDATLADLYDPNTMPADLAKAHQKLDKAVEAAYGKSSFKTDADRVAFLFSLYQKYTSLLPAASVKKARKKVVEQAI